MYERPPYEDDCKLNEFQIKTIYRDKSLKHRRLELETRISMLCDCFPLEILKMYAASKNIKLERNLHFIMPQDTHTIEELTNFEKFLSERLEIDIKYKQEAKMAITHPYEDYTNLEFGEKFEELIERNLQDARQSEEPKTDCRPARNVCSSTGLGGVSFEV